MTDQQAVSEYAQQKDAHAFRHLVNVYQGLVYSAARRQLANPHDIDDVVQQTFLDLAHSCHSIHEDVGSWLYTTALHNATDLIRKDQTRRRHEALAPPPTPSDPRLHILSREEWQVFSPKIDDAILALPPDQRTLIIQHFFQNRSQRELAKDLRVSHPTVRKRLNAAIETLRRAIGTTGNLPAAPALIGTLQTLSQTHVPAPLSAQLTKIGLSGTGTVAKPILASKSLLFLKGKVLLGAAAVPILAIAAFFGFLLQRSTSSRTPAPVSPAGPIVQLPEMQPAGPIVPPLPSVTDAYGFRTEDFLPLPNYRGSRPDFSMASDTLGNVFLSGEAANGPGTLPGLLRRKSAGQDRWETAAAISFTPRAIAASPLGDLYGAATWNFFQTPGNQPLLRGTNVDNRPGSTGYGGMALDADGTAYFCGGKTEHWIVRKQALGKGDFLIVDDYVLDPAGSPWGGANVEAYPNTAFAVTIVPGTGPSAGIYVSGHCNENCGTGADGSRVLKVHWIVRRSTDRGNSWVSVDDFVQSPGPSEEGNIPWAICADRAGTVYVAGSTETRWEPNGNHRHWVTRASASGNRGSWNTVDYFDMSPMQKATPHRAVADAAGNVYVAGGAIDESGQNHALIRTNNGGAWHTIEDFPAPTSFSGLAIDTTGRLYAAAWTDGPGWIIRSAQLPSEPRNNKISELPNLR